MRILFVLENYLPHIGGVEIIFKHLCEGLVARGHKVTVITHRLPGTKREEMIGGVRVIRVRSLDSRYVFTFTAIPAAIKYAKDADIIHTTTYNGAFPAWIGAVIRNKPRIITVHESWMGHWKECTNFGPLQRGLHEILERCVYYIPRFDRYVCVSNATRKALTQALPRRKGKIITIHNGFDEKLPKEPAPEIAALRKRLKGRFVVFASGRPGTSKGFEYLVGAFPDIKKRVPNAVLLLMLSKDAQYRHVVEGFKRDLAGTPDVIFVDPQPYAKLSAYRSLADCIVVPSLSEGFGYAVLEAAVSGVPLVATDTASIPEVVWGKHVLVRPKNGAAIADGVVAVSKGRYITTKKKRFPWKRNIDQYEKTYLSLLRKSGPPSEG